MDYEVARFAEHSGYMLCALTKRIKQRKILRLHRCTSSINMLKKSPYGLMSQFRTAIFAFQLMDNIH